MYIYIYIYIYIERERERERDKTRAHQVGFGCGMAVTSSVSSTIMQSKGRGGTVPRSTVGLSDKRRCVNSTMMPRHVEINSDTHELANLKEWHPTRS